MHKHRQESAHWLTQKGRSPTSPLKMVYMCPDVLWRRDPARLTPYPAWRNDAVGSTTFGAQSFSMRNFLAELHDSLIFLQYLRNIFVLCLVGSELSAISAADPSTSSQYIRTDFTVRGLPDNTVDAVTQTDNGLLWVGNRVGAGCLQPP